MQIRASLWSAIFMLLSVAQLSYFECHVPKWMDEIKRKALPEKSAVHFEMCALQAQPVRANIMAFVVHTVELLYQLSYIFICYHLHKTHNGNASVARLFFYTHLPHFIVCHYASGAFYSRHLCRFNTKFIAICFVEVQALTANHNIIDEQKYCSPRNLTNVDTIITTFQNIFVRQIHSNLTNQQINSRK